MTIFLPKSLDAASPAMLIFSVSLHALVFLGAIVLSSSLSAHHRQMEEGISRVKLVESGPAHVQVERMQRGPVKDTGEPEPVAHETRDEFTMKEAVESPREIVEPRLSQSKSVGTIKLSKRKRSLEKVELPKPAPKNESQGETAKKKPEAQDFLEKRLAALRKQVENKKSEETAPPSSGGSKLQNDSRSGAGAVPAAGSGEVARWMDGVRRRINSRWSVLGDTSRLERFTVVGVRIADDGRLVDASVDESSGDPLFDRSAMRAVFQASPFPPVPPEVKEKIRQAGGLALRFTPGGLQ